MISVIVCSRQDGANTVHPRNVAATIGGVHDYVRIDNQHNRYGICAAYNRGVQRAQGDILVFVHEDVLFVQPGWGALLEQKFAADPTIGLIGVAGTQYLYDSTPYWIAAGPPFTRGRVVQCIPQRAMTVLTLFNESSADAQVVGVDGLFIALRASLFERISFDATTFPAFHFYDLDICMQATEHCRAMVTSQILVKHLSAGCVDEQWRSSGQAFLRKWAHRLPCSCSPALPSNSKGEGIQSIPLTPQQLLQVAC